MTSRRLLKVILVGVVGGFVLTIALVTIGQYWDLPHLGIAVADFALESRWKHIPVLRLSDDDWNSLATTLIATYVATEPPVFDEDDDILVDMPYNWPTDFVPGDELGRVRVVTWGEIEAIAERDGNCPYISVNWDRWSFLRARFSASCSIEYPEVRKQDNVTVIQIYGGDRHHRSMQCTPSGEDWKCEVVEETDT